MSWMFCTDIVSVPTVENLGIVNTSTRFGPGVRDQYLIQYVIGGRGYFNGRLLSPGQGFFVVPGMTEHYYPDEKDPWEYMFFSTHDPRMAELLPLYGADPQTNVFCFDCLPEIIGLKPYVDANDLSFISSTKLTEIFLQVFNAHIDTKKGADMPERLFVQAKSYISRNLYSRLSVDGLCRILGISQPYLYKLFMKYAGMSTKQYIDRAKLKEAKRLLLQNPNLNISMIASSLGFSDVWTFSKFFSAHEQLSPSQYRAAKAAAFADRR